MTKRIYRAILVVAMTVLLASLVLITGVLYSHFLNVQFSQLHVETTLAAHALNNEGISYFDGLDDTIQCRITWIDADGMVLYDSHSDTHSMENHLQRHEVREALETGYGESVRYSDTLLEQTLYAAKRMADGSVLRLSVAHSSVLDLLLELLWPLLLVLLVTLLLSLLLAQRLSRRIVQPLNELNLDAPLSGGGYEEIKPLLRRMDVQQKQLRDQASELTSRKKQFDMVTRSMTEGLLLLDYKTTILSMNPAAARLLEIGENYIGSEFLSVIRTPQIAGLLLQALSGEKAEVIMPLREGFYEISASPVKTDGRLAGVVLLIFDITEKQRMENQRREFTANVSHELKTPLHTISGYAELLKNRLVAPGDIPAFSDKIYTEAQRMIHLIEDILKLSSLDEVEGALVYEMVDLDALAEEVVRELKPMAEQMQVSMEIAGEKLVVQSIPHLLRAIVTNLCTNAIKYNRPGGSVHVGFTAEADRIVLRVSDTGIGIAPEHQERIFERFYRVDKSHSKAVGGTGLGLSIVKHAALILGAKLQLHSVPGSGTTIVMQMPAKN